VVQNGEVVIVDEFTGRLYDRPALERRPAPGRRGQGGGWRSRPRNQTLASITFQNYFRLYGKLAGMTGTADTEAYEFQEIYGLETVVIPPTTDRAAGMISSIACTRPHAEKIRGGDHDIRECYERGQPVLVGRPRSRTQNSYCRSCWRKAKLPHQVLNAKQHAREADIIAQRVVQDDHHRHQYGGPRDRHRAGGNVEKAIEAIEADEALDAAAKQQKHRRVARCSGTRNMRRWWLWAVFASSPPSATSHAASTTSCVGAPAVRVILVLRAST